MRKYFQGTYFWELYLKNCNFHRRYFINKNQKFDLGIEATYNVDQPVVNSYFQPKLKLQYLLIIV